MKIAIATEGSNVSEHFGKCNTVIIVEIDNTDIKSRTILNTEGNQHGLLPAFLASHNVNVVIAGGMGEGARQNLMKHDIEIIVGASGSIDEVIDAYLKGDLISSNIVTTNHGHSHDHYYGEAGCDCGHNKANYNQES